MDLSLIDRIMLLEVLPKEGNFKSLIIVKDIYKKIEISQDELKKYAIEVNPKGGLMWNKLGVDDKFKVEFSELETIEITLALKRLDAENKLTIDMLGLAELFKLGK